MIDLSKNTNPYFPTKKMKYHLRKSVNNVCIYPDKTADEYEKIISNYFDISYKNVFLSLGTLGAFDMILKYGNFKKIGFLNPTFWGMKELAKTNNCKIIEENMIDLFQYDYSQIENLAKICELIYICNPNNPTLSDINVDDFLDIVKKCSKCHFVVDETVLAFDPKFYEKTLFRYVSKFDNLTVILSCSKIFNIPGLRLGLMFSNEMLLYKIKKNNLIFSSNIMTNSILDDLGKSFFEIDRNKFCNNFELFINKLNKDCVEKIVKNNGSFVLVKFKDCVLTDDLELFLLNNNVKVANVSKFYPDLGSNWFRVSVGRKRDMIVLANLINNFVMKKV